MLRYYQRNYYILGCDQTRTYGHVFLRSKEMSYLFFILILEQLFYYLRKRIVQIQQYRPICLLNVSFKTFTKVGTNRVEKVAHSVVQPTQTAFMPAHHILEGVVVLHETIHELHRKKLDGVLFKIYFEKAYNKVHWDFFATSA
jgi:hypothetical protein